MAGVVIYGGFEICRFHSITSRYQILTPCFILQIHLFMDMYQLRQSPTAAAIGLLFALVAVIGTRFLGWEWGGGQLIPTVIGVVATGIAVFLLSKAVMQ